MIINPSNAVSSIEEYYFSKKLKEISDLIESGKTIINLGIGNPDLAPSAKVIKALSFSVSDINNHGYQTYRGIPELRKAFADWYSKFFNVNLDFNTEILPLMGSKAGIMHISKAFLNPGDEVLVPNPAYPAYESVAKIIGAKPIHYDLKTENNWLVDIESLEKSDLSKVKLMWINYPNMPTGQKGSSELLERIIEFGKRNKILIVNDNPYSFILNEDYLSILSVQGASEVAIELNSLSKSHNMAGWRIGAIFGNKDYITAIQKIQSNMISGMFLPIQKAAVVALNEKENWYKNINIEYKKRREIVWEVLDQLECQYEKSAVGMFVWAEIPNTYETSYELSDYLLKKYEIFITPGGIFGSNGNKYIRISLCNTIETFQTVLRKLKTD